MKKFLSILMAALITAAVFCPCVFAEEAKQLRFNDNGKFRILHLTDVQDGYPMNKTVKQFINEALAGLKPDLVVLGGDNTVSSAEDKAAAIEELCNIFVENKVYFTLVFGNHDHQQMFDMENYDTKAEQVDMIKEQLLSMYQQYGGEYCLAYDADPALFGAGTHNLTIKSADGSRDAYNLYMMDSNGYYPAEDADKGYDAVHTDEIEWYKETSAALKAENNGKTVPALMFQHIIVQEIYEKMFVPSFFSLGDVGEDFEAYDREGVFYYSYLPVISSIEEGFLFEKPCPGYYNYGQLDAIVKTGDVKAVFSGHDHTNDFVTEIDGVKIINSAGCTYNSYGNNLNRGVRVIDLDEKNPDTFTTYTYTLAEAALADGSKITEFGDIDAVTARFSVFGRKFLAVFMNVLKSIFPFAIFH